MSKGKLGVLEGLSLIKDDGTRPHYLEDTAGVIKDAKDEVDVESEPAPAALEDIGKHIDLQNRLDELQRYIDERTPLHAATRAELIKITGEMVQIRGNLRYRDELLGRARVLLTDLYAQLGDQQAMPDDSFEPRLIAFLATLDGLGVK